MATDFINKDVRHVVCESSYLSATYGTGRIVNLTIDQDIDNGKLLNKGAFLKPEVYQGGIPEKGDEVYLVLNVPLIYENYTTDMQAEHYFYNAANTNLRSYPLFATDIFTVSQDGIKAIDEKPVEGNLVISDGVDIKEVAKGTDVDANGFVGEIIEEVYKSNGLSYRIEVIKNQTV